LKAAGEVSTRISFLHNPKDGKLAVPPTKGNTKPLSWVLSHLLATHALGKYSASDILAGLSLAEVSVPVGEFVADKATTGAGGAEQVHFSAKSTIGGSAFGALLEGHHDDGEQALVQYLGMVKNNTALLRRLGIKEGEIAIVVNGRVSAFSLLHMGV
jgi:hypothetical protein